MAPSQLSKQAYERLQEELAERSGPRRKEISAWIERAREHGDIRENADYDAAKNEQGHNEARVRQLEEILRTAEVVAGQSGDVVTISYLVGSIEERSEEFEVLSTSSPLGQALLEHAPGDTVSYQGPRREFAVKIVSVRPVG